MYPIIVFDREKVIAVSGGSERKYIGRLASLELAEYMESRKIFVCRTDADKRLKLFDGDGHYCIACSPVIVSGDVCGAVLMLPNNDSPHAGETEIKLTDTVAKFIGKTMEG